MFSHSTPSIICTNVCQMTKVDKSFLILLAQQYFKLTFSFFRKKENHVQLAYFFLPERKIKVYLSHLRQLNLRRYPQFGPISNIWTKSLLSNLQYLVVYIRLRIWPNQKYLLRLSNLYTILMIHVSSHTDVKRRASLTWCCYNTFCTT